MQHRLQIPLALAAGAFLGGLVQDPAASTTLERLDVHELRILNADGRPVVWLSSDQTGVGRVEVCFSDGAPAHVVTVLEGAARHELRGAADNHPRLLLTTDAAGAGALQTCNGAGAPVTLVGATKEGDGGFRVATRDGERVYYLGDNMRGNGVLPDDARNGRRLTDSGR